MKSTNLDIAITHITTRKRQTIIAALGVLIGVGIYLFMNSLSSGFSNFSRKEIFKNSPHIKIYKEDEITAELYAAVDSSNTYIVSNPQIKSNDKKIINPMKLIANVKQENYVVNVLAQVEVSGYYNKGSAQIKGNCIGVNIIEYSKMFSTNDYIVAGDINQLMNNINGIIIGSGIAQKLNTQIGEFITIISSQNVLKNLQVVGIYQSGNANSDNAKSYINIATAQQLLQKNASYVSNIFIETINENKTPEFAHKLQQITPYKVEDWKESNADILATDKTRSTMMGAISMSILLVASFGIYNILSATISQKINDIAILKAIGFTGKDVIKIFVAEALIMGIIGTVLGLGFASILIGIMQNVYMGAPVGYFPIIFNLHLFIQSFVLGLFITLCAGYFPARKAANVDPVSIFRK